MPDKDVLIAPPDKPALEHHEEDVEADHIVCSGIVKLQAPPRGSGIDPEDIEWGF